MNYNSGIFWALFLVVMIPYWFLSHKGQNRLLLVVSYIFYGFWDYRFLFLILFSTYIDFIGGLGVAGVRYPWRKMIPLTAFVCLSSLLLCTGIRYDLLWEYLRTSDFGHVDAAFRSVQDHLAIPAVVTLVGIGYVLLQPWLFSRSENFRRKGYLIISLAANLGILGYFKYCDFFIVSFRDTMQILGLGTWSLNTLGILLPAGISFYTFQSMSYCIDIYRREADPTDDFMDFALFVCFFPHLVAGPIMRAHTLLPQVVQPRRIARKDWEEGLYLVLVGMFKKIVIADNLAPIANHVFYNFANGNPDHLTGADALIGVYAFALQIYGDFSGYSSVARGISKWLGFELAINFNLPYLAVSPSDFWKRWHISLSSWLRDYLYIPLGGNRGGTSEHVSQSDDHDAPGGAVARGQLDLCRLGSVSRREFSVYSASSELKTRNRDTRSNRGCITSSASW
ncbi:MAG: MBOAT family O-acyltransferase [Planctomycetales bacterium]